MVKNNVVLKNRNFRKLLIGNAVSQLGNWLFYLTILYFISGYTGSISSAGFILAINVIPVLVFGPFAGGVADKYNRKHIIVLCDLLNGLCSLILGLRALQGTISLVEIGVFTFIMGVGTTFFNPALRSSIPNVVKIDELSRANSLFKITIAFVEIFAPLVGGVLITVIGAPIAFIINGVSYIISSIMEIFISIPQFSRETRKSKTVLRNFAEGFGYIKQAKFITTILFTFSVMTFFAAPMIIYLKQITEIFYNDFSLNLSLLIIADSVGVFLASLFLSFKSWFHHQRTFVIIFPIFCGIALIILANIPVLIIAVTAMFFQGFIAGLGEISMDTILQKETPDKFRGSVLSAFSMILTSLMPFSYLASGVITKYLEAPQILTISGIALIICSSYLLYKNSKGMFAEIVNS